MCGNGGVISVLAVLWPENGVMLTCSAIDSVVRWAWLLSASSWNLELTSVLSLVQWS